MENINPIRIQRKRTKGWRMPENTVYVGRPTKWGNPHKVGGKCGPFMTDTIDAWRAKFFYLEHIRKIPKQDILELRGKNLACWCRLDQPCHADILLLFANGSKG